MADDPIKSFMVSLGFTGDEASAKKVVDLAQKTEDAVTKAAEEGADKRVEAEGSASKERIGIIAALGKIFVSMEEDRAKREEKVRKDAATRDEKLQAEREKKARERREKALKEIQVNATRMASFALKAVGAIEATALGIVYATDRAAKSFDKLNYAAQRTGAAPGKITAFGYAAGQLGSTEDAGQASLEALGQRLRTNPNGYANMLKSIGVQARDANGHMRDTAEIAADLGQALGRISQRGQYGYANAMNYANAFGMDEQTMRAAMDPRFRQRMAERQAIDARTGANQGDAARSGTAFEQSMRRLEAVLDSVRTKVETGLFKTLQPQLEKLSDWGEQHGGQVADVVGRIADDLLKLANAVLDNLSKVNWDKILGDIENFGKEFDKRTKDLFGENGPIIATLALFGVALGAKVLGPLNAVLSTLRVIGGLPIIGRLLGSGPTALAGTMLAAGGVAGAMNVGHPGEFGEDAGTWSGDAPSKDATPSGRSTVTFSTMWNWMKGKMGLGGSDDPDARKVKDAILQTAEGVKKLADGGAGGGMDGGGAMGAANRLLGWAHTAGGNAPRGGRVGNFGEKGWWTDERQSHAVDRLMKEAGLTEDGAKALVSRWSFVESPGGPASVNPRSGAEGIGQWLGSRKGNGSNGSFDDQIGKVIGELNNGTDGSRGLAKRLLNTPGREAAGASAFERAEGYNPATGEDNFTARTRAGMAHVAHGVQAAKTSPNPAAPSTPNASSITKEQYEAMKKRHYAADRTKPWSAEQIRQYNAEDDAMTAYERAHPAGPMGTVTGPVMDRGKEVVPGPEVRGKARTMADAPKQGKPYPGFMTRGRDGEVYSVSDMRDPRFAPPVKVDVTPESAHRIGAANAHYGRVALGHGPAAVHALAEWRASQQHLRNVQTVLRAHRGNLFPMLHPHMHLSAAARAAIDMSRKQHVEMTHSPTFNINGGDPRSMLADAHRLAGRGQADMVRNMSVMEA